LGHLAIFHVSVIIHVNIPVLARGESHEDDHSIRESLKVVVFIDILISLGSREKIDSHTRVNEKYKGKQSHDV